MPAPGTLTMPSWAAPGVLMSHVRSAAEADDVACPAAAVGALGGCLHGPAGGVERAAPDEGEAAAFPSPAAAVGALGGCLHGPVGVVERAAADDGLVQGFQHG